MSLAAFNSLVAAFSAALSATVGGPNKGTKSGIALRDSLASQVISNLKQLAQYVQANSNGDLSGTGFKIVSNKSAAPQQVATPSYRSVKRGASGQLLFYVNAVKGGRTYQIQYAVFTGTTPDPSQWTVIDLQNVKSATTISGLTPGTVYAFQVRANGPLGWSDWSDSYTIMAT